MSEWIDTLDPMQWVDALAKASTTLPFWIVVVLAVIAFLRYGVAPVIEKWGRRK